MDNELNCKDNNRNIFTVLEDDILVKEIKEIRSNINHNSCFFHLVNLLILDESAKLNFLNFREI